MKRGRSGLDAIIIADYGDASLSGTSPFKLRLDGREATVQVVRNYLANEGRVSLPIDGDGRDSWAEAPRLNGIYLYSYLTEKNLNVALIGNYSEGKELFRQQLTDNPKAVVISTPFIFFKDRLRQLVEDIRSIAPDIFIIAGGAFVNASYLLKMRASEPNYETAAAADDYLFLRVEDEPAIDLYIISARGEATLFHALKRLSAGHSPYGLENTARLQTGAYTFGGRMDDAPNAPPPEVNWNLLPDSFFRRGVMPVQASNGCPYQCAFCNFTKDERLLYVKPVDRLVAELKVIEERGGKYVWFVDDNFRLGRNDLTEVCKKFIDADIQLQWMCFIRASTLAATDLELLHRAGCREVQIGLESGDPGILHNMNKNADPAMYEQVIGDVLQHSINVSCYFIAGFPGETPATALTTRNFIRRIEHPELPGTLSWSIYPFILSPLSPVYEPEMRRKFGLTGYMHKWSHLTMDCREARREVVRSFMELEHSGPIYRGDNLDYLETMSARTRKDFYRARHGLAKISRQGDLAAATVLSAFNNLF